MTLTLALPSMSGSIKTEERSIHFKIKFKNPAINRIIQPLPNLLLENENQ